jgi:hypothetical protein
MRRGLFDITLRVLQLVIVCATITLVGAGPPLLFERHYNYELVLRFVSALSTCLSLIVGTILAVWIGNKVKGKARKDAKPPFV